MRKITSKDGSSLLAVIIRFQESIFPSVPEGACRENYSPVSELLQVASIAMAGDKCYPAHYHIAQDKPNAACQEAWVVFKGAIQVVIFDLDHKFVERHNLYPGDCFVNFAGGHSYRCLTDRTFVYEFKTGPYLGGDKVMIE